MNSQTRHQELCFALGIPFLLVSLVAPAGAQDAGEGKWEIEIHGGGMLANRPTGGTAALPDAGAPFLTTTGRPSRRESSWYFGDGALLLNQLSAAISFFPAVERVAPLDTVLTTSAAERQSGGSFGMRVSRLINSRFTAEASVDYSLGRLDMTSASLAGIEASRRSFASTWTAVFGVTPFLTPNVTSVSTIHNSEGHQLLTTTSKSDGASPAVHHTGKPPTPSSMTGSPGGSGIS